MDSGRALMIGKAVSLPQLPPTPANRLWLGTFVDAMSSGGSNAGVEVEEDMEELLWSVPVGDAAGSRPYWKALAAGLIWQAVALGGKSVLS